VVGSANSASRCGLRQSVICGVGDREDVWQAGLPLLCCYEAAVDPVIDDPHTDAASLANLVDVECTGGKRRAGNAMLVADPSDHADREALAGRACEAVAVYHCDDLIVIERGCQGTDASNERIGITKLFGAVQAMQTRQADRTLPGEVRRAGAKGMAVGSRGQGMVASVRQSACQRSHDVAVVCETRARQSPSPSRRAAICWKPPRTARNPLVDFGFMEAGPSSGLRHFRGPFSLPPLARPCEKVAGEGRGGALALRATSQQPLRSPPPASAPQAGREGA
jgi:hypothetical protein